MSVGAKVLIGVAAGTAALLLFGAALAFMGNDSSGDTSSPTTNPTASPTPTASPEPVALAWNKNLRPGIAEATALNKFCAPIKHYVNAKNSAFVKQIVQVKRANRDAYAAKAFVDKVTWLSDGNAQALTDRLSSTATTALSSVSAKTPTSQQRNEYETAATAHCKMAGPIATAASRAAALDSAQTDVVALAQNVPWYPKGYSAWSSDETVAWKWQDNVSCDAYTPACWGMDVITQNGCSSSLYAEIAIKDRSGAQIDYSNDTTGGLAAMTRAKLTFQSFDDAASTAELTDINCY
jgi:hypothetical protein